MNSYLDTLYSDLFPEQKRKIATDQFDELLRTGQKPEIFDPNAVLNPLGASMPQKQPMTYIEAKAPAPIEYPEGYKIQAPESEIIRQNVNEALIKQQQEQKALSKNISAAYNEREGYKKSLQDTLMKMQNLQEGQYSAPEIDAQIKALSEKSTAPQLQERSALADVIALFGAPVLGAISGETGALAQMPAAKASRDIYEGAHKQELERVKLLKENTDQKLKALIDIKKSGQESFDKSQARQLEKVKAELGATKDLASMSSDDLKSLEDKLFKLNASFPEIIAKSAKDITNVEQQPGKQAAAEKRAQLMAGIAQQRISQPTEGERKGAFQLGLMQQAEKNLQDLKEKHGDYPSMKNKWFRTQKNIAGGMFGTTAMSDLLNSKMISPDVREQIQYELSFLESIGRIQSGAAITVGEWGQMREQYFPTYGDAPQSVASKEQQRQKALEGVAIVAGKAKSMVSPPKSVVSQFPKKVYKGKQSATVSNEKELREARSEGWK